MLEADINSQNVQLPTVDYLLTWATKSKVLTILPFAYYSEFLFCLPQRGQPAKLSLTIESSRRTPLILLCSLD
jgi:hypothetical protein